VNDGWEAVDFTTTTTSDNRESITKGQRERTRYRDELEYVDRYMAIDDVFKDEAGKLMRAPVGRRAVREGGRVFWEQVEKPEEPWGFEEMTRWKVNTFYEKMLSRPQFVTPSIGEIAVLSIGTSVDRIPSSSTNSTVSSNGTRRGGTPTTPTKLSHVLSKPNGKKNARR